VDVTGPAPPSAGPVLSSVTMSSTTAAVELLEQFLSGFVIGH
jgi:hypothetical protein